MNASKLYCYRELLVVTAANANNVGLEATSALNKLSKLEQHPHQEFMNSARERPFRGRKNQQSLLDIESSLRKFMVKLGKRFVSIIIL